MGTQKKSLMCLSASCPYLHGVIKSVSKIEGFVLDALDYEEKKRGQLLLSPAPVGSEVQTLRHKPDDLTQQEWAAGGKG